MPKQLFANNAKGKLNAGILLTDLSLPLQAGQGALFPSPTLGRFFAATLIDASGNIEVIHCTARTGDTFTTISRGEEGTAARAFSGGDKVELRWTKASAEKSEQTPDFETLGGNSALDAGDVNELKLITATATLTLPDLATLSDRDWIEFKSLTTGDVRIAPNGTDTIDGLNAFYRLPSFCVCRVMRTTAGQWKLVKRPNVYVGQTIVSASANAPMDALPRDASAVSRVTYAGLFAEIGVAYGAGDGVNTFNVPDSQGRASVGAGAGAGLTVRARGDKFGAETHTLTQAETPLKDHTHPMPNVGAAGGNYAGGGNGAFFTPSNTGPTGDPSATPHSILNPFVTDFHYIKT